MTTTGTYTFNPALGGILGYSLGRSGVRRAAIGVDHLADAAMASNLILAEWGNTQPNLWTVDLQSVSLPQGTITITCPAETVQVLDVYITLSNSGGYSEDRILSPVGRSEYAAYPVKTVQGTPSIFWYDRTLPPTLTFYEVPDASFTYTLNYYRVRQLQDASIQSGATLDMPPRLLMAFADRLAAELSLTYAIEKYPALSLKAKESKALADAQDREKVAIYINAGMDSYYRR